MNLRARAWWFDMAALIVVVAVMILCDRLCRGDEIRLPMRSIAVTPEAVPVLTLEPVDKITSDEWYIVDSDVPLRCLTSPEGILDVEPLPGPMTFRGRFAGGDNRVETRKFAGPYLYAVTALTTGKAELIAVASIDEIERVMLTISGPRPPPGPGPGPEPPKPKPEPVVKNVTLAIVVDLTNLSTDASILLNALYTHSATANTGNEFRLYDQTTQEIQGESEVKELNGVCPGIVIRDKATAKVIHKGPLPATFAELKALVGRLTGA